MFVPIKQIIDNLMEFKEKRDKISALTETMFMNVGLHSFIPRGNGEWCFLWNINFYFGKA